MPTRRRRLAASAGNSKRSFLRNPRPAAEIAATTPGMLTQHSTQVSTPTPPITRTVFVFANGRLRPARALGISRFRGEMEVEVLKRTYQIPVGFDMELESVVRWDEPDRVSKLCAATALRENQVE